MESDIRYLHSFILLRRGEVVAEGYWEPYAAASPHMLFSLSKSFTSTAIGMLVAEGRLSVDDHVLDYFPDEAPAEPSDNLRAMRIRHLLTMTTGHVEEPLRGLRQTETKWTRAFLAHPVERAPGTHFLYNSLGTYMLSAIAQRITGERVVQYLQPRLFTPLGIAPPVWETSPEGIDTGGWGLNLTTREIARFGQLYLQKGVWNGQPLIPEAWVAAATAGQVPNGPSSNPDWEQGYGYQFWRCRHGAYRGDGAFGQYCVVLPEQEAVLAITSGLSNMQSVLDRVWEHLLPAMGGGTLPEDRPVSDALANRLAKLRLPSALGQPTSPIASQVSGREFVLRENPERLSALGFDFAAAGSTLNLRNEAGEQRIRCGFGEWEHGTLTIAWGPGGRLLPIKVAASGTWTDDQTYVVEVWLSETPFRRTLTCHFAGDTLTVDQQSNVSFGPVELPKLEGQAT
ncbi:MAG TPA: serine hydrolase [Chloroflexota bacterium]|nr:serine hydrolase [Chloroflexota bacterium]